MTSIMSNVFAQLVGQAPLLLVYVVGIVVALSYGPRYRGPATMTLIASAALLAVSVGQAVLVQYVIQSNAGSGTGSPGLGGMLSIVAIASSLVRAAATGLIIAAVFTGRTAPAGAVA
jgi:low affinity Fe/Cu permease